MILIQKSLIVLTKSNGLITGSARSVEGFNLYDAIDHCSDLLEQFGGHTHAAGLSLKEENLEEFKEKKLIDEAKKVAKKLNKLEIKIPTKCGKGGKLFGSISNVNLNNELTNAGFEFDKKIIKVQGGLIKRLGNYSATIRLHRDVINEISFEVVKSQE